MRRCRSTRFIPFRTDCSPLGTGRMRRKNGVGPSWTDPVGAKHMSSDVVPGQSMLPCRAGVVQPVQVKQPRAPHSWRVHSRTGPHRKARHNRDHRGSAGKPRVARNGSAAPEPDAARNGCGSRSGSRRLGAAHSRARDGCTAGEPSCRSCTARGGFAAHTYTGRSCRAPDATRILQSTCMWCRAPVFCSTREPSCRSYTARGG